MAEILVLVDHVDGAVRKPTLELLTLARRLGEPAAVFLGPGADTATEVLGRYGARRIHVVDAPEIDEYLVTPAVDALTQIAERTGPAAILLPSGPDGKEIAARVALRLGSDSSPTPSMSPRDPTDRSPSSRRSPRRTRSPRTSPRACR